MASPDARKKAARTRATARAQARTRQTVRTPGRMVEQGVGWGNIARGIARIVGSSRTAARPAATAARPAASSVAKKTAAAKKTTAARRPAQRDVLTAGERAQLRAEQASRRARAAGNTPLAARKAEQARALGAKQTERARLAAKPKMSKKKKAAIGGGVLGVGTLAYATKPKSMASEGPRGSSPVSSTVGGKKRKNVVPNKRTGSTRFRG